MFSIDKNISKPVDNPKVVHCKKEPNHIYIGRPSKWGNPYGTKEDSLAKYIVESREEAIEQFKIKLDEKLIEGIIPFEALLELKDHNLGCWCSPKPCHGDILLKYANCEHNFYSDGNRNKKGNHLKQCIHCKLIIPIE